MSLSTSLPAKLAESADERLVEARRLLKRKLVGKWLLERVLGIGATSSVFAAVHNNGHRVAIKVLHRELAFNNRVKQRFLREGYLANKVGHSGVVAVIDDGIAEDGTVFLVLELLSGASLSTRVLQGGGKLDPHLVLRVAHGVLDVLEAAHAKGIIHRDIKPANVFLTDDQKTKVLDFGLARLNEVGSDIFQSGSGGLLGTPAYMAPEQARGAPGAATARTDLWCLGATMFRLLSGRTVHAATTVNQLIIASATEAALPLRMAAPFVSESVSAVVDRALKLNPADRFESAAEMKAAVAAALATTPPGQSASISAPDALSLLESRQGTSTLPDPEEVPVERSETQPTRRRKLRGALVTGGAALTLLVLPVALIRLAAPSIIDRPGLLRRALDDEALQRAEQRLSALRASRTPPKNDDGASVLPSPSPAASSAPAAGTGAPNTVVSVRRIEPTSRPAARRPSQTASRIRPTAAPPSELPPDSVLDNRK